MTSIFHFYKDLFDKKDLFEHIIKLEDFSFNSDLLSCINKGVFPDLAIRLNKDKSIFTGGELIKLKDSDYYLVSSFNSTIPTAKKSIDRIIKGESSHVKQQMELAGDDIYSMPERNVFYLVRGRNKKKSSQKIVLVDGSFFETIGTNDLISRSFSQVLNERLKESGKEITPELELLLTEMFSEQENFSKVRSVDKASVKLRFRIMTEVKAEGNILNETKYPEIKDNTLNLILPYHTEDNKEEAQKKMNIVFTKEDLNKMTEIKLKHHFNGYFIVYQTSL